MHADHTAPDLGAHRPKAGQRPNSAHGVLPRIEANRVVRICRQSVVAGGRVKPRRSLAHPNGGRVGHRLRRSPAMRRRVGPMAWCVLESVVAASDTDGVARVSIRSVAAELGVSKNAVHRAMTMLRDTGLVVPVAARSSSGRFASGAYRVSVAPVALKRVRGCRCCGDAARPRQRGSACRPSTAHRLLDPLAAVRRDRSRSSSCRCCPRSEPVFVFVPSSVFGVCGQTGARGAAGSYSLMLRVTTLHASSAAATAAYYAKYLTDAPGEVPGVWSGGQADRFRARRGRHRRTAGMVVVGP